MTQATRKAAINPSALVNYPFTQPMLLRGLRSYLADSSLTVQNIQALPPSNVTPGAYGDVQPGYAQQYILVEVHSQGSTYPFGITLYQADHALIQREHGFYSQLAQYVFDILTPGFIIGDPKAGWFMLETMADLIPPDNWKAGDYREAVENLAKLHNIFWNLGEELESFDWLWQPLGRDYRKVKSAVNKAVDFLTLQQPHAALNTERYQAILYLLDDQLDDIAKPLREEPFALTHGSYWAGNIAQPNDGSRQKISHWQYAAIVPAILDVVMFHQSTISHLTPALPVQAAIDLYRAHISSLQGKTDTPLWNDQSWEKLWDYGLMWLFAIHWLERIANMPSPEYAMIHSRIEQVWLAPLATAIERRFKRKLPK